MKIICQHREPIFSPCSFKRKYADYSNWTNSFKYLTKLLCGEIWTVSYKGRGELGQPAGGFVLCSGLEVGLARV